MSPSSTTPPGDTRFQLLQQEAARLAGILPVPGASFGIYHRGEIQAAGVGVTNLDHPLPVTAGTLFQVGSITKTFTATIAMRLVEQGLLDLERPLRAYLPGLRMADPSVAEHVTMLHLLTHTGGWEGDYFEDFGRGEDASQKMVEALGRLQQVTPLGALYAYNNAGFYLAGRVIECITGQPYETVARQMLLDPLGMQHSFFYPEEVMTYRFAAGHIVDKGRAAVGRPWATPRAIAAAGGLISTVPDLLAYARFHLGDGAAPDGTRLLSPASLALMRTPRQPSTGLNWVGLSWFMLDLDGRGTWLTGHGGATLGQQALLRFLPGHDFAIAVLTNSDEGDTLYTPLLASAVKHYLGLDYPEPQPLDLPAGQLAGYAGVYDHVMQTRRLTLAGNRLLLESDNKPGFPTPDSPPPPNSPPAHAALYAEDKLLVLDGPGKGSLGEFLRGPNGEITWLRLGGRLHRKLS